MLGMVQGEFPRVTRENWIYNDRERAKMKYDLGIDLPTTAHAYEQDAYFFAAAATTARRELTLTYFEEDGAQPSPYVETVQELFRKNESEKFLRAEKISLDGLPSSPRELMRCGRDCALEWLRDTAAAEIFSKDAEPSETGDGRLLDKNLLRDMRVRIGNHFSSTSIKCYVECPFKFLGTRVWCAKGIEALDDEVRANEEGELLHAVVEKFINRHLHEKIFKRSFQELRDELRADFEQISAEYTERDCSAGSESWRIELPRLWRLLVNWLHFEIEEQKDWTGFTPNAMEWSFGENEVPPLELELGDGARVQLSGRVDRIDSDGEKFFITDYKRSSGSVPSEKAFKNKLDVQLPLYMLAVQKLFPGGKRVAGGSYYSFMVSQADRKKNPFGKRRAVIALEALGNNEDSDSEGNDAWERFEKFVSALLREYIEKIYGGIFPVEPRGRVCDFCELKDICRNAEMGGAQDDGEQAEGNE